jgi:hypothetical protein
LTGSSARKREAATEASGLADYMSSGYDEAKICNPEESPAADLAHNRPDSENDPDR